MFQAIAIYDQQEVGYGESETAVDALIECEESVPAVYPSDEVQMYLRQNGELVACVGLSTSQVAA
jgi:hypothetical protein